MKSLANPNLSLSAQALSVLQLLADMEPQDAPYDDERHEHHGEVQTSAWYNGRERGVCLVVRRGFLDRDALFITFGEHRNSDSIFIDTWRAECPCLLNPPTVADFCEERDVAYANRKHVPYGQVGVAADVIRTLIVDFLSSESFKSQTIVAQVLPELGEDAPAVTPRRRRLAAGR